MEWSEASGTRTHKILRYTWDGFGGVRIYRRGGGPGKRLGERKRKGVPGGIVGRILEERTAQ